MKQGLQIRQAQTVMMTPQMQESIRILQLGSLELVPYITNELEQNPFLERDEGDAQSEEEIPESNESERITAVDKLPEKWEDGEISPAVYESESLIYSGVKSGIETSGNADMFESFSAPSITLREHIISQINSSIKDPVQRMIGLQLTEFLDDSGYLIQDITPLSQILRCEFKYIESTVGILQQFDPPGVFARDLSECLAIQLRERNRLDPAMEALLGNLDLMAKCDFKSLRKICGVDEEDLKEMCQEIKALNPKPGNNFSNENVQPLQPDIFLKKDNSGNWVIELNSDALPRLLVNRRYYAQVEASVNDKDSKKFLSERWSSANWLVKALDMRANTILKVATEIVAQQSEFFHKGIHYLRPLVISDIAAAIEAHESTVSRVINGKYIATNMGMYELKYFFSSGISGGANGEDISSKRIKYIIKQLIDEESHKSVLSDDKIAEILKKQGVEIARRTVMKYREALGIPSSTQRRREKVLSG